MLHRFDSLALFGQLYRASGIRFIISAMGWADKKACLLSIVSSTEQLNRNPSQLNEAAMVSCVLLPPHTMEERVGGERANRPSQIIGSPDEK